MTENTTVKQINSVVTEMKMVELSDGSKIPVPRLTTGEICCRGWNDYLQQIYGLA